MSKLIHLPRGKFAICDDWSYELLIGMGPWYWEDNITYVRVYRVYVDVVNKKIQIPMSECVKGPAPRNRVWDHIDRNGFNNQVDNLRLATHSQNMANRGTFRNNTSGYRGVSYHIGKKKFSAKIGVNNRPVHLGDFNTPEAAAVAYNEAAIRYFGPFGYQNVINGVTGASPTLQKQTDLMHSDSLASPSLKDEQVELEETFGDLFKFNQNSR